MLRVNGALVNAEVVRASDQLRTSIPSERSTSEVAELRKLADTMVGIVRGSIGAGATMPLTIINTPTGAVLVGLVSDPVTGRSIQVPVEHVILVHGGGIVLMVSGKDNKQPAKIGIDGVLEISQGGSVAVLAYGLQAGAGGEVVVMSKPRRIDSFTVDAHGGVSRQAKFPSSLPSGSHTIVVTVGDDAASLGFRILKDYTSLPKTGFAGELIVLIALLFMSIGLTLMTNKSIRRS